MSRCELSGKSPSIKNLVSHSNIKTKFLVQPNIQRKQLFSTSLGRFVRLQVATSTIRTMEHNGGFDAYILNQADEILSRRALAVKRKIQHLVKNVKKAAPKAAAAATSEPVVKAKAATKVAKKAAPKATKGAK